MQAFSERRIDIAQFVSDEDCGEEQNGNKNNKNIKHSQPPPFHCPRSETFRWLIRAEEIVSFLIDNKVGKPSLTYIAVLWQDLLTDLFKEIRKDFFRIRPVCSDYHNLSQ